MAPEPARGRPVAPRAGQPLPCGDAAKGSGSARQRTQVV